MSASGYPVTCCTATATKSAPGGSACSATPPAPSGTPRSWQWSHELAHFTRPGTVTATERTELTARAIGIVEGTVEQLVLDNDRLCGVQLGDGCVVPRDTLFVPPTFVPNDDLLLSLGCDVDQQGWVTTDATGRTTVYGVWAAGSVIDARAL